MLLRQASADALGSQRPGSPDPRAEWTALRPVRHLGNHEGAALPALEIVSVCRSAEPGLVRDHGHAFVRLIDAGGGVSPIGFFPDESTAIEPDEVPGLRMPGMLLVPDKYDRIAWNPLTTRIPLDGAAFRRLVDHIESMQRDRGRGTLSFDILDRSCVGFVVRVAALAGIAVSAEVGLGDFLAVPGRPRLTRLLRRAWRIAPSGLRRLGFNLGLACRGGFCAYRRRWKADAAGDPVLEVVTGIRPLFAGWGDVARCRIPFFHVRALREWQRAVADTGLDRYRA